MDAEQRAYLERMFDKAACERLAASTHDYYSTHGEYIPPLAALLNETRAERDQAAAVKCPPAHGRDDG